MAHLALVVDLDSARRARFVSSVRRLFSGLPGTHVAEASHGPLACVWAAGPLAPIDLHHDGESLGILIGYGLDESDRWITSRDLLDRWLVPHPAPVMFDGYHVAVAWSADRGLAAGVDPLGMFPLQQAVLGDGPAAPLLVTTTPEAFRCHPLFETRVDRRGLAGILLVHGPLHNRPLLAGTARVPKGHLVRWTAVRGGGLEEVSRLRQTPTAEGESQADIERRIGDAFVRTIHRHRPPGDDASILLSGGLDSRLVAASLCREGIPTNAIVLGRDDDFEVIAGTAVARRLGIPLEVVNTELIDGGFADRIRTATRFSHLTSAPGADDFAEGVSLATSAGRYLWSGIAFDWVLEPVSYADGRDPKTGRWACDGLLAYMNRWGVDRARLPMLLGDDGVDLCDEITSDVLAACLRSADAPELEASRIRWDQRVRNHLGMAVHRLSFHSWPLMPATDRRFFEAVFSLPVAAFRDRVIEKAILRRINPGLCALPLDTNSFRFSAMAGKRSWLGKISSSAAARIRRVYWTRIKRRDPRRYERLFSVDHPRWQAVRREVESLRPLLQAHLDPVMLRAVLPPAGTTTSFANPVNSGGAVRLLLGLAILLKDFSRLDHDER
jgi:hypothetical protein